MMKKLFSIVLCFTLLLSCMPAMAAVTGGDTLPSLDKVANLYTVDLSGDAPALMLNGEAVADVMTERGTVSINTDAVTGEKSAKLTNGADLLPADMESLKENQYSRWGTGSALSFNMGANAFNGNVLIKFKVKDELVYGNVDGVANWSYGKKPLQLGAAGYISTSIKGNKHDILFEDGGVLYVNEGTSNNLGKLLTKNTWYDYTILYNTAESKFKFWLDGVQMIGADDSEWFADDTAFTAGLDKFNLGTLINTKAGTMANFEGSTYFKDIAFGLYDESVALSTANKVAFDFESATEIAAGNAYYQKKLNASTAPANYGDNFLHIKNNNNGTSGNVVVTDAPAGTTNAPATGKVLKIENIGSHYHGASLKVSYGNATSATNSYDENIVVEFDFCNASTTDSGLVQPIYFGPESSVGYQERDMLKFDKTGIYVQTNLVKEENTLNKWYHVKVLYAPTADIYKVWIDGEPMSANGSEWFNNMQVDNSSVILFNLGVGEGASMPVGTAAYYDNFEIYQLDNCVSFESPQIGYDLDTRVVSSDVTARNKTASDVVAVPVIAIYDQNNNVLEKLTIGAPTTVAAGNTADLNVTASVADLTAMCKAKAFIWDTTFDGMTPFDADMFFGRSMADGVFTRFNIDPTAVPEA